MRLFAFGCSFTSFYWPTWADILGQQFDTYHNFGMCATGNEFIFHRLTEAQARYNITANDLVIIQWTNFAREDRYKNGRWVPSGNIFTQEVYPHNWVRDWFDLRGAFLKTSSVIAGATHLLENTGCEFHFTSMMPMAHIDMTKDEFIDTEVQDILTVYKKYYDTIKPSMAGYLFNSLPYCRNPEPIMAKYRSNQKEWREDNHPTPLQHLRYTKEIIIPSLRNNIALDDSIDNFAKKWEEDIRNKKPGFVMNDDGWSAEDRYQKWHGELC